jgi:hypothetical protein
LGTRHRAVLKGKSFKNLGLVFQMLQPTDLETSLPEELPERLKVPVSWIFEKRRSRCKNPIPAIPMGKVVRFNWSAVVKWLEEQAARDVASIEQKRNSLHARKRRARSSSCQIEKGDERGRIDEATASGRHYSSEGE